MRFYLRIQAELKGLIRSISESRLPRRQFDSVSRPMSTWLPEEFGIYRKLPVGEVDCPEMRPIADHLVHLASLLDVVDIGEFRSNVGGQVHSGEEQISREVSLVVQWLRMAAAIRVVDLDFSVAFDDPYLCSTAMDYREAEDEIAAIHATELARLQYAWNAMERLLLILDLPTVPQARGRFNGATEVLRNSFPDDESLPIHYLCTLRHLRKHVEHDVSLGAPKLRSALEEAPWRATSGMLLAAANQLRHIPAHGDFEMPSPESWGDDREDEARLPRAVHAPRLATRGLALSLQMLVVAFMPKSFSIDTELVPDGGFWEQDLGREWSRTLQPAPDRLFLQAHLRPPEDEEDDDDSSLIPPELLIEGPEDNYEPP